MKATGLAFAALLVASAASAQEAAIDDWDFEEPAQGVVLASVTFDTLGIGVRCMDGSLNVVMSGLPLGDGARTLRVQYGDRPEREEPWASARNSGTLFAIWPRHVAAILRQGGRLSVRADEEGRTRRYVVDLPPSPSAIDRVVQACGRELDTVDVDAPLPTSADPAGRLWVNRPEISFPSQPEYELGMAALTCQVTPDGRVRDCIVESEFPAGSGFGRSATLGAHRTARVKAGETEAADARPLSFVVRYVMAD